MDEDEGDESCDENVTSSKSKSQFNSDPSVASTARLATKPMSSLSASASNATIGICNPAFDFEDDEDSQEQVHSFKDDLPPAKMSKIEEQYMEEDEDGDTVREEYNVTPLKGRSFIESIPAERGQTYTRDQSSTDEHRLVRGAPKQQKVKPNGVSAQSSFGDQDADTDEDAQSISLSTVSEASTVIAGESGKPQRQSSSSAPMVSSGGGVRRSSRKKVASNEGNVKIVEIKSRDVVQGILRMEPKMGGSGGGAKEHVNIVKVPLVASQKQQQPSLSPRSTSQKNSSHITHPSSALNVSAAAAGSGSSLPNKTWLMPKVRKINALVYCNIV